MEGTTETNQPNPVPQYGQVFLHCATMREGGGWVELDGRPITDLTSTQQAVCLTLQTGPNLFDAGTVPYPSYTYLGL